METFADMAVRPGLTPEERWHYLTLEAHPASPLFELDEERNADQDELTELRAWRRDSWS